ncbi:hypothetical protein HYPSUDRAFT_585840 [Hypholoma sublateritium FD-334 SS-4]|uniref:Uncharacterized protein n=1 Tax=Hypholoma sublateritium (strain FD-334 SS-4) TaxID=945553 RepID=A0A0D2NX59_HYPSF|nr:hypothetical protein HYPSUDRAFT_585840 [Hypholoma sublateritium FD-334 SS-4]
MEIPLHTPLPSADSIVDPTGPSPLEPLTRPHLPRRVFVCVVPRPAPRAAHRPRHTATSGVSAPTPGRRTSTLACCHVCSVLALTRSTEAIIQASTKGATSLPVARHGRS